jgi:hypothetical protein
LDESIASSSSGRRHMAQQGMPSRRTKEPGNDSNEQAYAWAKKYDLLTLGGSSFLVLKLDTGTSRRRKVSRPEPCPQLHRL